MRLVALVIVFVCTLASAPRAQAPVAPERFVRDYVAAFNAGEEAMREFFRAHAASNVPVEQRIERYRDLRSEVGRLTLRHVDASNASAIAADLSDEHGGSIAFTFVMSGSRLEGIRVEQRGPEGPGPREPPLAPMTEAAAIEALRALVGNAVAADAFSGVVLVEKPGSARVWSTAVGEADEDAHTPNTLDTRFNVGSIGKSFTATAIAQLLADGKLALEDTVGKFLPDYPNAAVRQKVTVKHLLEMQSGIGDIFGPRYERTDKATLKTLPDYLPLFANEPLAFEPGSKREYSNGGYVVLGLIVEKVSGQSYHEYVRSRIFERAGMKATEFLPPSGPVSNRATGYTTRLGGPRRSNTPTLPWRASSAGGVHSTAPDLLRYAAALEKGTLVSGAALAKISRDTRGMGLAGGSPGANAALETGVNGYTIIVLSNYDPPSAERLAGAIRRVLESVR
jgi:CubicO group peptidase (beta-lactamase class C family)